MSAPPAEFQQSITEFVADLRETFPEYHQAFPRFPDDMVSCYEHCLVYYPARFFDILNKNAEIFAPDSEIETMFLPGVEFKALYGSPDVTETTKENIWKYLQLILFRVMDSHMGRADAPAAGDIFGDIMKNMNMDDIRDKVEKTLADLTNVFGGGAPSAEEGDESSGGEDEDSGAAAGGASRRTAAFTKEDAEGLYSRFSDLLNGKIGQLAKELTEDVAQEINQDILGGADIPENVDAATVIKNLFKDPAKISNLVHKVGGKLEDKIRSGELSQEEMMKETADIFGKMQDIPGLGNMKQMIKQFGKMMGGGAAGGAGGADFAAAAAAAAAKMGSGARVNTNMLNQLNKHQQMKDRMRERLEARKQAIHGGRVGESGCPSAVSAEAASPLAEPLSVCDFDDSWIDAAAAHAPVAAAGGKKKKSSGNGGKASGKSKR